MCVSIEVGVANPSTPWVMFVLQSSKNVAFRRATVRVISFVMGRGINKLKKAC